MFCLALSQTAQAAPIVNNNGTDGTDTLFFPFILQDSAGNSTVKLDSTIGGKDSVFLHIFGPNSAIVYRDSASWNGAKIIKQGYRGSASRERYVWKQSLTTAIPSAVSGVYAWLITAIDNTGAALETVSEGQFQLYAGAGNDLQTKLANLDAAITSRLAPTVAARTLDIAATGEAGIDFTNALGQLNDSSVNNTMTISSVTGAVGSVTGAVGSVTGNVGGSVASVTGNVGGSVVGSVASVTGNLGGNVVGSVGSVTGAVGSVTGAVGSVAGAVGSVTGNVGGNVVGTVASVTGAVGSVTGNLGGNVVGNVTGSVGSVTGNVGGNVVGSTGSVVGAVGSVTGNVGGSVGSVTAMVSADAVRISGLQAAADNLQSMLDGTGGVTFSATLSTGAIPAAAFTTGAAQKVWDLAYNTAFAAGSMGDSLSNATAWGGPLVAQTVAADHIVVAMGIVAGSPAPTTTSFSCSALSGADNYWNSNYVLFVTGAIAGQVADVQGYTSATKVVTMDARTAAPVAGDSVYMMGIYFAPGSGGGSSNWSDSQRDSMLNGISDVSKLGKVRDSINIYDNAGRFQQQIKDALDSLQTLDNAGLLYADVQAILDSMNTLDNTGLLYADVQAILDSLNLYDNAGRFQQNVQATLDTIQVWDGIGRMTHNVQDIIDSINAWDAANGVTNDVQAILDSLRSQDNWIPASVWNVAFNTAWPAGSMGDSLNNASFMQGTASGLTPADVWNYPFNSAHTAGSMGDSLNNATYVQGAASGLTAAQIWAYGGTADAREVDVQFISDDGGVPANLETMLDGTGGQKLSLGSLVIKATGTDTGLTVYGSGNAPGAFFGGAGSGSGIMARGVGTGAGIEALGRSGAAAIYAHGQDASGVGTRVVGGTASGNAMELESVSGNALILTAGGNGSGLASTGAGTGDGLRGTAGLTGNGLSVVGGATSGRGFNVSAPGNDWGAVFTGAGGGGGGILAQGTSGSGTGIKATGLGAGAQMQSTSAGAGLRLVGAGANPGLVVDSGIDINGGSFGPAVSMDALAGTNQNALRAEGAGAGHGFRLIGGGGGYGLRVDSGFAGVNDGMTTEMFAMQQIATAMLGAIPAGYCDSITQVYLPANGSPNKDQVAFIKWLGGTPTVIGNWYYRHSNDATVADTVRVKP